MSPARGTPLSVLLLEDQPRDEALIRAHLEDAGFSLTLLRVDNGLAFRRELESCCYDVILSDYNVPGFEGTSALEVARALCPSSPFIFVTGELGEVRAIELLKLGATDYVLKSGLERLASSIQRARQEQRERENRRQAEEALRRSEERSRALVAALTEGVIVNDNDGIVQDVNLSAQRLLGATEQELIGASVFHGSWEVFNEDGPLPIDQTPAAIALSTGRGVIGHIIGLERRDGSRVWLSVNAQPLFEADRKPPVGVVQSFSDITEHKRRAEFEQQLIGIVSHDLRNPISAMMLSAAALLKREDTDARFMRALARIMSSGERALRLIRDLLDFTQARLGSGIPLQRSHVNLYEVARQVVEEVGQVHPEREIRFSAQGELWGDWDGDRIGQVVTNLAVNALSYSDDDAPVRITVRGETDGVSIEVWNHGDPIPDQVVHHLFEPFRRGRDIRHGHPGSVGLGLFIVHQVVQAHGGVVGVRSSNGGTTFTVRLPRRTDGISPSPEAAMWSAT